MTEKVLPVLLAGGSGTRLWPASRADHPKPFLRLLGDESLFQATCRRLVGGFFNKLLVLGGADQRFLIAEQLVAIGLGDCPIVLEPVRRDTAAAACVAALLGENQGSNAILLTPCDTKIGDSDRFRDAVARALPAARNGDIVLFGVPPTGAATGYGYFKAAGGPGPSAGVQKVLSFAEKPPLDRAEAYLSEGGYFWNSGIFLFSPEAMIEAFATHQPEILNACRRAVELSKRDLNFLRLDQAAFEVSPSTSLDYGIMERLESIACVQLDTEWSDCGSWPAIRDASEQDSAGNAVSGDVQVIETTNSLVRSEGPHVVVVGMDNVSVVATPDAVLVTANDKAERVKAAVREIELNGREELLLHPRTHRPWGWYERLRVDNRYQVKRIMVKPGGRLSLQSHHHRSEHWVVVSGSIEVTRGEEVFLLPENTSAYIPIGVRHRIANPGKIPAVLIEVQSGSYVGEDDIIRYEDVYGRVVDIAKVIDPV